MRYAGREYDAVTSKPIRCGWFDSVIAKNEIVTNDVDNINLTKLDALSEFKNIKIGVGYKLNGKTIQSVPDSLEDFAKVEVKYIEMPGWEEDISNAEKFADLPQNAQDYVIKLEEILEIPIDQDQIVNHFTKALDEQQTNNKLESRAAVGNKKENNLAVIETKNDNIRQNNTLQNVQQIGILNPATGEVEVIK